MTYYVKEIYYTLQGEGANSGKPSIFCRFSGCNLWSGLDTHKKDAKCNFCDTDFVGTDGINGGRYKSAKDLTSKITKIISSKIKIKPLVVFTGGEPLLQLDQKLISEIKKYGFQVAIETNGTILPPKNIDWICVSPKGKNEILLKSGDELKFVFPQKEIVPSDFKNMKFKYFFLQPLDNRYKLKNTELAIKYCLENPMWKLSLQTHKIINLK